MVRALDYKNCCKAQLGSYVETHEDIVVTNTQHPRKISRIYLDPTGNIQGALEVFDLKTGGVKKLRTMTDFPMPNRVINIV